MGASESHGSQSSSSSSGRRSKICSDGAKCRRRNREHLDDMAHPFDPDYCAVCFRNNVTPKTLSLRDLFDWVDTNESGKISATELSTAMPLLSALEGHSGLGVSMETIDEDRNGLISFGEFVEWASPRLGLPVGVDHLTVGKAQSSALSCSVPGCTCEGFVRRSVMSRQGWAGSGGAAGTPLRLSERLHICKCGHKQSLHSKSFQLESCSKVPYPRYWKTLPNNKEFHELVETDVKTSLPLFQKLLDRTYKRIWTRDRKLHNPDDCHVPRRYRVTRAFRSENTRSWRKYGICRAQMLQDSAECNFPKYGDVKSTVAWIENGGALADRLKTGCNEWYLFHGTSEASAKRICEDCFKFSRVGQSTGMLYGRGIYFAESITKADEYSKPNEAGEYTVLLCRALGGRVRYLTAPEVTDPNPHDIQQSCIEGPFDSILGDREKIKRTYREFVFFDTENIYPEYIIHYVRDMSPPSCFP